MRIGIDIRCLLDEPRSGVGEYTYNLLKALLEGDSNNSYVLFSSGAKVTDSVLNLKADFENQPQVDFFHLDWPNKILNFLWWLGVGPKLDKLLQVDTVWLPQFNFVNFSKDYKFIITCHDVSFIHKPELYSLKGRFWHWFVKPFKLFKNASKILAVSQATKNDLISLGLATDKIEVIYPIVNWKESDIAPRTDELIDSYKLPDNFFLYIGTLDPRKNIMNLLEAYLNFQAREQSPINLIIAGRLGWHNRRYYKKLFTLIESHNQIKYLGYVPLQQIPYLYTKADVFIYPSFYEGFGFPPLEAMQYNCPVIASQSSSIPEVTRGAAYLIDPYNRADLEVAMLKISKNENLRNKLIQQGQEVCHFWQAKSQQSTENLKKALEQII